MIIIAVTGWLMGTVSPRRDAHCSSLISHLPIQQESRRVGEHHYWSNSTAMASPWWCQPGPDQVVQQQVLSQGWWWWWWWGRGGKEGKPSVRHQHQASNVYSLSRQKPPGQAKKDKMQFKIFILFSSCSSSCNLSNISKL